MKMEHKNANAELQLLVKLLATEESHEFTVGNTEIKLLKHVLHFISDASQKGNWSQEIRRLIFGR